LKKQYILFLTLFIILLKAESQIRLTAGDNTVLNRNTTTQVNSVQDIFAAVNNGDLNDLKKAVHKDTQLSALVDSTGNSLLHFAAALSDTALVSYLVQNRCDVNSRSNSAETPLHIAAEKGRLEVVELLLDKGAEINDRNGSGSTPYNLAADFGHREVCDLLLSRGADSTGQQYPVLSGNYFGQKKPEGRPRIMAADIVSTRYDLHGNIVFSKDADLAFWSGWFPVKGSTDKTDQLIMTAQIVDGKWTKPIIASFSQPGLGDDSPFITPDGKMLFFVSERPLKAGIAKSDKENIWFVTRNGDSWSEPQPLIEVNHLNLHWQLSADKKGNLYFGARDPEEKGFGEIFCSDFINGKYQQPRKLSSNINSENSEGSPYISPDGDYLLFDRSTSFGQQMGIYISFRNSDGSWMKAVPIAEKAKIYPESHCPRVTSDGKYLFYMSWLGTSSAAFWTKADFINELR